jgi:DNA-binding CsgD family transcriptional regulator/two-component sensor histidine kinase
MGSSQSAERDTSARTAGQRQARPIPRLDRRPPRPALLLVPPYVGFELLAFFVADVLARDAAARTLVEENSRLAERLRIARELHDVVGHRLTALSINLEVASRAAEASARESIASAHALARAALQEVRAVVAQLRDPERLELSDSLRTLAAETPGPRIHLTVPDALCRNDAGCALTLLRCTQEILTNAVRHAEAENLWIEIVESDGCIRLRARDDGRGADNFRLGHGLRGMHERIERAGGKMEIDSFEQLVGAIRVLAAGGSFVQPTVTEGLLRAFQESADPHGGGASEEPAQSLTGRELEVLRLMAGGYSNREIARALFVAERTIKNHVSSILSKLYVRDRTRAVLKALEKRLL